jgi:hypothetical protein
MRVLLLALALAFVAAPAAAQQQAPVSGFVVDARGSIAFYPDASGIAEPRRTTSDRLPGQGLGMDVGGHVYPFRWKAVTFGFGATLHFSRGGRTPDVVETESGATPGPDPVTVQTRFSAIDPEISLNFGSRMGWSYLSGGFGWAKYRTWREDLEPEDGDSTSALNFGGGARWFINDHVALSLDLRFHMLRAVAPATGVAGHPRLTIPVANVGVSIR